MACAVDIANDIESQFQTPFLSTAWECLIFPLPSNRIRLIVTTYRFQAGVKTDNPFLRALAGFNLSILDANLSVVQIDGGNMIEPTSVVNTIGILYPGERMDIILSNNLVTSLKISLDQE
jgi:hypothetical protein